MRWVQQAIRNASNIKILFLSATPMKQHPYELGVLLNLLKPKNSPTRFPEKIKFIPKYGCMAVDDSETKKEFEDMFYQKEENFTILKNQSMFKNMVKGLISYYSIERDITKFPSKIEMRPINVKMSPKQLKEWTSKRNSERKLLGDKISCSNSEAKNCDISRKTSLNILSTRDKIYKQVSERKTKDISGKVFAAADMVDNKYKEGKQFIYTFFNIHGLYTMKGTWKRGWCEYGLDKVMVNPIG